MHMTRGAHWPEAELQIHVFSCAVTAGTRIHRLDYVKHRVWRGPRRREGIKLDRIVIATRIPTVYPDGHACCGLSAEQDLFQSGDRIGLGDNGFIRAKLNRGWSTDLNVSCQQSMIQRPVI